MNRWLPALVLCTGTTTAVPAGTATAMADDAPPARITPPRLDYRSAFTGVTGRADAEPVDWSRSNALVGALKGHAGHLRGAPSPTGTPAPAGAAAPGCSAGADAPCKP
jgi:hypothetical protein